MLSPRQIAPWRRTFEACGQRFHLRRGVFDPARHLSGVAFAEALPHVIETQQIELGTVVDVGTGSGVLAAVVAPIAQHVIATDIDPRAVRCAAENLAGLDVEVRLGDLFEPLGIHERVDLVIANPPYEIGDGDHRYTSPDLLRRLAEQWATYGDHLLLGFPADDAASLDFVGFDVHLVEEIPTAGRPLGIYRGDAPCAG